MYLLYAFYSCRSVPRPVDIWRILLSLSRFCRADFRNCRHGYYGCYCGQPILLRCKTPERYLLLFKKQRALIYIVIVWCLAFAGSVPPFSFEGKNSFKFQPGKAMCLYTFESNLAYSVTLLCLYVAAPLTIIAVSYVKVFRSVSRSNRAFCPGVNPSQLRANVEEAKVTRTLVAALFGFACCWLPISVMDTVDAARGESTIPQQVYLTYGFLIYLSSTINPFIYGIINRQFRREYKALLRKITIFRRQNGNNNGSHNAENDA